MKKHLLFTGIFAIVFIALQHLSGVLLMVLYAPQASWNSVAALPSQVDIGYDSRISPLVIVLLALVMAFGAVKLIDKRLYKGR